MFTTKGSDFLARTELKTAKISSKIERKIIFRRLPTSLWNNQTYLFSRQFGQIKLFVCVSFFVYWNVLNKIVLRIWFAESRRWWVIYDESGYWLTDVFSIFYFAAFKWEEITIEARENELFFYCLKTLKL